MYLQDQPKRSGSAQSGARQSGPGSRKPYSSDQLEQYRAYYEGRQQRSETGARPASSASQNTAARRPAASASQRTASSASQGTTVRRPASSASQRTASSASSNTSARRPASSARRSSSSSGGGFLNNGTVRMLAVAALAVLLMFGLIKLIGRSRGGRDVDYVPPMKTEDYLAMLAASAQPDETAQLPDITQEPDSPVETTPAVDDATEPPPEATSAPTSATDPDEGYFPSVSEESVTPAPTAAPVSTDGLRTARLRFAGDVVVDKEMLTTAYNSKSGKYNFSRFFGLARDLLSNADLTAINVDGSMGGEKYYKYGYSGYPQFNTPPTIMYALQEAGVDMLTLANNHCLDGWWEGFKQTITNADYVGLMHIGGFRTKEEHDTPEIIEVNGIKIGFLNYTQSFNSMDTRGVDKAALSYGVRSTRGADYAGDIKKVRAAGAEVVIVVMHWGKEYLTHPDDNQKAMAKEIVAAGADVIVGGHPHVAQVGGWITATMANGETNNCLIIYSLGNFLTEHRNVSGAYRTDWGVVFEFTLQENPTTGKIDVIAPKYLPVGVWRIGSPGAYDWRVVSVDSTVANRPAGMSDAAYERFLQISEEAASTYVKSGFERTAY